MCTRILTVNCVSVNLIKCFCWCMKIENSSQWSTPYKNFDHDGERRLILPPAAIKFLFDRVRKDESKIIQTRRRKWGSVTALSFGSFKGSKIYFASSYFIVVALLRLTSKKFACLWNIFLFEMDKGIFERPPPHSIPNVSFAIRTVFTANYL